MNNTIEISTLGKVPLIAEVAWHESQPQQDAPVALPSRTLAEGDHQERREDGEGCVGLNVRPRAGSKRRMVFYPTCILTFQWLLDKMYSVVALLPVLSLCTVVVSGATNAPTAQVKNGTYIGRYSPEYNQDLFLGMPYAQPPIGDLRFRQAQSLNDTWEGAHEAWAYSPLCVGYGVSYVYQHPSRYS